MKIKGAPKLAELRTANLTINAGGSEVTLKVCAIPWRVSDSIERMFPLPSPPVSFKSGGRVQRAGGKPVAVPNLNDPEYLKTRGVVLRTRIAAIICEGLSEDKSISWDTKRPDPETDKEMVAFYYAILEELHATGIASGTAIKIANCINELSDLTPDVVGAGIEDFTQPGE